MQLKKFSLIILLLISCTGINFAQFGTMPPFTVEIEPVITASLPGTHSFAFAQSGDKWLIIGGRTNGLHGVSASGGFPPEYKNDAVIVIDTATWTYYSADLNQLPQIVADPMRSTNMQYLQDGNYLYMFGGYGYDSATTMPMFVTFPTMTAVHVDNMINAVINAQPIAPHIRQVADTNFAVCGGEVGKIGNDYYLMFGHNFGGRYTDPPTPLFTQQYADRIRKFSFTDDGTTITLSSFTQMIDTTNFHRRDLCSSPIIRPDGSMALMAYGGAFRKDSVLPFREPITITSGGTTVHSYQQVMSHYTCPMLPIYDSVTQTMYMTFFGGISLYDHNDTTGLVKRDSLVPFINDITTMTIHPGGMIEETVLPVKFSSLLGSNAKFVLNMNTSHYVNEVIRIRDLPNSRIHVGYIYGGIRATAANFGPSSYAHDTVYRVYITPNNNVGILENENIRNVQLFPNPATSGTMLLFSLKQEEKISVEVYDITGKKVISAPAQSLSNGSHALRISTSELSPGIYICKLQGERTMKEMKLVVGK